MDFIREETPHSKVPQFQNDYCGGIFSSRRLDDQWQVAMVCNTGVGRRGLASAKGSVQRNFAHRC